MDKGRLDCSWCGSAASIEYHICQVCMMEYPMETEVIQLPLDRPARKDTAARVIKLDATSLDAKEAVAES